MKPADPEAQYPLYKAYSRLECLMNIYLNNSLLPVLQRHKYNTPNGLHHCNAADHCHGFLSRLSPDNHLCSMVSNQIHALMPQLAQNHENDSSRTPNVPILDVRVPDEYPHMQNRLPLSR